MTRMTRIRYREDADKNRFLILFDFYVVYFIQIKKKWNYCIKS